MKNFPTNPEVLDNVSGEASIVNRQDHANSAPVRENVLAVYSGGNSGSDEADMSELPRYARDYIDALMPFIDFVKNAEPVDSHGVSRGNVLEKQLLVFLVSQLQDPDSALRRNAKVILKDLFGQAIKTDKFLRNFPQDQDFYKDSQDKLLDFLAQPEAVDALIQLHYWHYMGYAADEFREEQDSHAEEFVSRTDPNSPLSTRWAEISKKHPEFQNTCRPVIEAQIDEALAKLRMMIMRELSIFFLEEIDFFLEYGLLNQSQVDQMKVAIEAADPESFDAINMSSQIRSDLFRMADVKLQTYVINPLLLILNSAHNMSLGLILKDPASDSDSSVCIDKVNINHFVYPIQIGWYISNFSSIF